MNRREFITGAAGTSALAVAPATAAAQDDGSGEDPRTGSGTKQDPYVVDMITDGSEYVFDPVGLHVEPGDVVEWRLVSGTHTATSYTKDNPQCNVRRIPEGAESWDSGNLEEEGASFTHTFETPGTYDYYCVPHKSLGMVARLVCGEPGGPATEGSIPDDIGSGVVPDSETIVEEKALSYPHVPGTGGGALPALALGGLALFGAANAYLFGEYDRRSGRYEDGDDDRRTGLE